MSGLKRVVVGGVVLAMLQLWAACSASEGGGGGKGGGGGTGGSHASKGGTGGGVGNTGGLADTGPNDGTPIDSCAELVAEAKQTPLGMLIVLDKSTSMGEAGKWTAAQLAIVQAIDLNSFDNLSLGMTAYPAGDVPGPACIGGFPVGCGVSALPQVPLADSATAKSNTPGV